jgi:hypothetical protein
MSALARKKLKPRSLSKREVTREVKKPKAPEFSKGKLIDTTAVCRMLRRTPMMIYNYRKQKGLPFLLLPGGSSQVDGSKPPVRFYENEVRDWALLNRIPCYPLTDGD